MQNTAILDIFQNFRMAPTALDQYESVGKAVLDEKLQKFTSLNKPIEFSMLGFPFKSMNSRDKVLGKLPDLGEELTFQNFGAFNNQVKEVYAPGVIMNIVSDGYIFNDLMDVEDKTVQAYEEVVLDLAKVAPVRWHNLHTFYGNSASLTTMRDKVISQFGIAAEELERRILLDPDVNFLYRGMIRFMTGDLAIRNFDTTSQLHKAAKKMAREMMFRNEAFSKMVQTELSDKIRLSMHPSVNTGQKYSFQLIPSPRAWTSPWHCAILQDAEGFTTIHRKDAEAAGHNLIYKNNQPYYYTAN